MSGMNCEKWLPAEDDFVRANYSTASWDEMVRALKRSRYAISTRASLLGAKRDIGWSRAHLAILHADYSTSSWGELEDRLGRSREAIQSKASDERLQRVRQTKKPARARALVEIHRRDPAVVSTVLRMRPHSYRKIGIACGISRGTVAGILRDHRDRG
jgi:biotin operon repressor